MLAQLVRVLDQLAQRLVVEPPLVRRRAPAPGRRSSDSAAVALLRLGSASVARPSAHDRRRAWSARSARSPRRRPDRRAGSTVSGLASATGEPADEPARGEPETGVVSEVVSRDPEIGVTAGGVEVGVTAEGVAGSGVSCSAAEAGADAGTTGGLVVGAAGSAPSGVDCAGTAEVGSGEVRPPVSPGERGVGEDAAEASSARSTGPADGVRWSGTADGGTPASAAGSSGCRSVPPGCPSTRSPGFDAGPATSAVGSTTGRSGVSVRPSGLRGGSGPAPGWSGVDEAGAASASGPGWVRSAAGPVIGMEGTGVSSRESSASPGPGPEPVETGSVGDPAEGVGGAGSTTGAASGGTTAGRTAAGPVAGAVCGTSPVGPAGGGVGAGRRLQPQPSGGGWCRARRLGIGGPGRWLAGCAGGSAGRAGGPAGRAGVSHPTARGWSAASGCRAGCPGRIGSTLPTDSPGRCSAARGGSSARDWPVGAPRPAAPCPTGAGETGRSRRPGELVRLRQVRCGPRGVGNRPPVTGWRLGARAVVAERERPRRLLRRLRASARTRCGPAVPHGWTSELHVGEAAFVVGRLVPGYRATRAQPARGGRCPRRWPPARRWRGEVGARPVGPGTRRDAARRQVAVGGPDRTPARSRAPAVGAVRTGKAAGTRGPPRPPGWSRVRRPRAARRRAGTAVGQGLRLLRRWPGQPPATPLRRKPVAGTGRRSHAAVSPNPVVGHRAGTGVGQPALRSGSARSRRRPGSPTPGPRCSSRTRAGTGPCRRWSAGRPAAEVRRVVPVRCVVPVVGFVVRVVEPAPVPVVPVVRHVVAVGRVVPPVVRGVVPVVRVVPPSCSGPRTSPPGTSPPGRRAIGRGRYPSVPRGWSAGAGRRVTPRGLPGLGHRRRHAGALVATGPRPPCRGGRRRWCPMSPG